MALFNIKNLMDNVSKSTEGIKKSISDATEKLPDSAKSFNLADSVKDMVDKGQETVGSLISKGEETLGTQTENTRASVKGALADHKSKEVVLPVRDALQIMYCLMAVDGTISEEEADKFDEIGKASDPYFATYKKILIKECLAASRLETTYGQAFVPRTPEEMEDYYDQIHDYVGDLIADRSLDGSAIGTEGRVRGKILLWNLLAIAYSEGDYSKNEKRLIRFIARKAGVEDTVLLDMEHTIRTLFAIEKEEEWLKSTDRPYRVIEARVNELADRKNTIMQGVNALIAD